MIVTPTLTLTEILQWDAGLKIVLRVCTAYMQIYEGITLILLSENSTE
jgi:hypothetical protein